MSMGPFIASSSYASQGPRTPPHFSGQPKALSLSQGSRSTVHYRRIISEVPTSLPSHAPTFPHCIFSAFS